MKREKVVFVSGANRGLGLEFVRQIEARGDTVIAGYRLRKGSKSLLKMAEVSDRMLTFQVDVTDPKGVGKLYDFIETRFGKLDLLINNAGIHLQYMTPIDDVDPDDIMENFRVNVIGPFLMAKTLRPLLQNGKNPKIVNISSQMGSIEMSSGNSTPYRISKAAVNMLSKNQALNYIDDGIVTVAMHPGWVRTDMGGPEAPLSPEESISGMLKVIDKLGMIDKLGKKDNGKFVGFDGKTRPY